MANFGCRILIAVKRRRRKKRILNIYWSQVTERLNEIMIKGGNSKLKNYGGGKMLQAINS